MLILFAHLSCDLLRSRRQNHYLRILPPLSFVVRFIIPEAMGTSKGVCKTQVAGRGWQAWYKLPYISYEG